MARMLAFDRLFAEQDSRVSGRRWSRTPLACSPAGSEDSVLLYVFPLGSAVNTTTSGRSFSSSSLRTICRYPLYSVLPGFGGCVAAFGSGYACFRKEGGMARDR